MAGQARNAVSGDIVAKVEGAAKGARSVARWVTAGRERTFAKPSLAPARTSLCPTDWRGTCKAIMWAGTSTA